MGRVGRLSYPGWSQARVCRFLAPNWRRKSLGAESEDSFIPRLPGRSFQCSSHLCTLVVSPGWRKGSVPQGLPDSDLGARGSLLSSGLGLTSPERSLPPVPRGVAGSAGERCRPPAWAPGGQTRETSAWKLEERPAPGLTRVSMETCVLHVAPLLPADGCWYLGSQPKTPCRCQRRHFRRSSACTWEKESGQAHPKEASCHADWAAVHLGCRARQS